ncbi:MAG: hypothetical protein HY815_01360 [Candidatus Riflebacteria bacterium]|nr:hypothetical protein [Candidatus Riflebacteria bacterium]
MRNRKRSALFQGFTLFFLALFFTFGIIADQGCTVIVRTGGAPPLPPPPPPPLGPTNPTTTTTGPLAPSTTARQPLVGILVCNSTEVCGFAYDSVEPTSTVVKVKLQAAAATAPTTATTTTVDALATVDANVQGDDINGYKGVHPAGHGFRFTLSSIDAAKRPAVGSQVVVRAENGAAFQATAPQTIAQP